MTTKTLLGVSLISLMFLAGCHYGVYDDYRDYGSSHGSYRDGYRDGRAAERRRWEERDGGRYSNRDWWRYR